MDGLGRKLAAHLQYHADRKPANKPMSPGRLPAGPEIVSVQTARWSRQGRRGERPRAYRSTKRGFPFVRQVQGGKQWSKPNSAEEFQFSTAKWRACGFEGFPPPPTIVDALSECGEWLPVDAGAAALQIPQWARPLGCLLRNLLKWSNFPDRAR